MAKKLRSEAVINPGNPGCRHYEDIRTEAGYGGHLIGRCRYCPKATDYTIAQAVPDELKKLAREKSRRGQAAARRRQGVPDAVPSY